MNIKEFKIHLLRAFCVVLVLSLFSSCNKWLDVHPSTQTTESQQFSSQQGYIDALIGVYQQMAENDSYGKELSFGMMDVLAQLYLNKASQTANVYGQLARYNYIDASVEASITRVWSKQYNIVAQSNYILKDIDNNRQLFTGVYYNLVKGEALAIRAMAHFDLLRLFAPSLKALPDAGQKTIPYIEAFSVQPSRALAFQAVIDRIVADLKEAEELLSVYPRIDPIAANAGSTSLELFPMFRQNRLNYWATKAILARVYLYNNNKAEALSYAKQVIDSRLFPFANGSNLNTNPAADNSNTIFSSEHIFSIYRSDLKLLSDELFKTEATTAEAADLFTTEAILNGIYERTLTGYGSDIRGLEASARRWNVFNTGTVFSTKYYVGGTGVNNPNQRLIPVVRLPEMYYIAAEASPSIAEGVAYLNTVRQARLIPVLDPAIVNTATLLDNELFKEYRKEFYAEGQLWFYYKRKNTLTLQNSVGGTMSNAKYVFPLPQSEIEFGLN